MINYQSCDQVEETEQVTLREPVHFWAGIRCKKE